MSNWRSWIDAAHRHRHSVLSRRRLLGSTVSAMAAMSARRAATANLSAPGETATWRTNAGKARIVGYYDMSEMLTEICALYSARQSGERFELDLLGTKAAPAALASGRSLLAPMGAEMLPEQLALYRSLRGSDPVLIRVAHDSLNPKARSSPTGVFVHRDNPLPEISLDTLARVVTAAVRPLRMWGELGLTGTWVGKPIQPHGLLGNTVIGQLLRLQKFAGVPYAAHVLGHPQSRQVVSAVAQDPNSIGFANLNHATPQVRALPVARRSGEPAIAGTAANVRAGDYPLDRHLIVYLARDRRGDIDPLARDLARLILSTEGQAIIAAGSLGYMPLNTMELAIERGKLA